MAKEEEKKKVDDVTGASIETPPLSAEELDREKERSKRIKKLTDAIGKLSSVEEKRFKQLEKTQRKLASYENLGDQLKDSILAPLKSIASSIPAPLRIMGKMAIAPVRKPMLQAKMARQTADVEGAAGTPPAAPSGFGVGAAFAEARGKEMAEKGFYKGSIAAATSMVPGLGALGERWEDKEGIRGKLSGYMGFTTGAQKTTGGADDIVTRLISIRGTLLGMASDLSVLATAGAKEGSIFVHDASVEEKLEEIDENTEPKKVSKAKLREDELEARKKKPSLATIKKIGPVGFDWKKLLIGLTALGGIFAALKGFEYYETEIKPRGGFGPWWEQVGQPKLMKVIDDGAEVLVNAVLGALKKAFGNISATSVFKGLLQVLTLSVLMKYAWKIGGKGPAGGATRGLVSRLGMVGLAATWGLGLVLLALRGASMMVDAAQKRQAEGEGKMQSLINGILFGPDSEGGIANAWATGSALAGATALAGFAIGGPPGAIIGGIIGLGVGAIAGYIGSDKIDEWGKKATDFIHKHMWPPIEKLLRAIGLITADAVSEFTPEMKQEAKSQVAKIDAELNKLKDPEEHYSGVSPNVLKQRETYLNTQRQKLVGTYSLLDQGDIQEGTPGVSDKPIEWKMATGPDGVQHKVPAHWDQDTINRHLDPTNIYGTYKQGTKGEGGVSMGAQYPTKENVISTLTNMEVQPDITELMWEYLKDHPATLESLRGKIPGLAKGGSLGSSKWGIVGEDGPELIQGPGTVIPFDPWGWDKAYGMGSGLANWASGNVEGTEQNPWWVRNQQTIQRMKESGLPMFAKGGTLGAGQKGIAGEAGPEMMLDRKLAMKEGSVGTASAADVDYQPRAILGRDQDLNMAKQGYYPGSDFYIGIQERKASSAIQNAGNDSYGNIDMGDDIEFEAATPRQERSLFRSYMRDEFNSVLGAQYALAIPAIYPRLKQAIQAEQAEGNIPTPMKHALSQEKYSKGYNAAGKAGDLDKWMNKEGAQREYDQAIDENWVFNRFGKWTLNRSVDKDVGTEYIDMARGRSYNRGGEDEYDVDPEAGRTTDMSSGHNLLSDYIDVDSDTGEVEVSGESFAKGKRSSYGKYTAKKVKKATAHLATGPTKWGMSGQQLSGWGAAKKTMGEAATYTKDEKAMAEKLGYMPTAAQLSQDTTEFGMPFNDPDTGRPLVNRITPDAQTSEKLNQRQELLKQSGAPMAGSAGGGGGGGAIVSTTSTSTNSNMTNVNISNTGPNWAVSRDGAPGRLSNINPGYVGSRA